MRMSDWSSDVCSSDLSSVTAGDVLGVTAANGASAGTYDIIVDQIALAHKLSGGPVQIGGANATSSSDALGLTDTLTIGLRDGPSATDTLGTTVAIDITRPMSLSDVAAATHAEKAGHGVGGPVPKAQDN